MEKPFINDWIHFNGDHLHEFFSDLDFPFGTPVKTYKSHVISRAILDLQYTQRRGDPLCRRIINNDLCSLFLKLSNTEDNNCFSEKSNRYLPQFAELRSELYGSPRTHLSVDQLAQKVHLSSSYFQHLYKEIFGCTVIDDIISGRIEYSEYLLENSTYPVFEIAQICGYQNDVHFMRQFKKIVGITPSQYRSKVDS